MVHRLIKDFVNSVVPTEDGMYEVENFSFDCNPQTECLIFTASQSSIFGELGFNTKRASALMLWYLGSNRNDISIRKHVAIYRRGINEKPPYYNSNYGYYFFDEGGLVHCIKALVQNKNSRQACVSINRNDIMFGDDVDKLCTNAVMFRIRDNKLNMTVQMRSNHFINNMPMDIFTFSMFYSMLFNELKLHVYKDLKVGTYHHTAASMHIHADQLDGLKSLASSRYRAYDKLNFSSPSWQSDMHARLLNWFNR
jgi:thymidylate synthase